LFTEAAAYSQAANADYLPPNSGNEKINGPASRMEQELNQTESQRAGAQADPKLMKQNGGKKKNEGRSKRGKDAG
jgi:hypothetical protein